MKFHSQGLECYMNIYLQNYKVHISTHQTQQGFTNDYLLKNIFNMLRKTISSKQQLNIQRTRHVQSKNVATYVEPKGYQFKLQLICAS